MLSRQRKPCKFFAQGACLKGDHCKFLHDRKHSPISKDSTQICNYYQKGLCSYGSRCKFQHVKTSWIESAAGASSSSFSSSSSSSSSSSAVIAQSLPSDHDIARVGPAGINNIPDSCFLPGRNINSGRPNDLSCDLDFLDHKPEDRLLCLSHISGDCPSGDKCPYTHGDECPTCGKHCLHPFRTEDREQHLRTCEKEQKHLLLVKQSEEIECCVCLDRVLSKTSAAERKFAVLPMCDHPFCMSCIMKWRNSSPASGMQRTCPTCRTLSHFVVPSPVWYFSQEEKEQIIDGYKAKLRSIDCKHFDSGNGHCPFGTNCFYKHNVKPGSYAWTHNKPPPRRRPTRRRYHAPDMDSFDYFSPSMEENMLDLYELDRFYEDLFDHLCEEGDGDGDDEYDELDDLSPFQMAFLMAQLGYGSSDEEDYEPY